MSDLVNHTQQLLVKLGVNVAEAAGNDVTAKHRLMARLSPHSVPIPLLKLVRKLVLQSKHF
ncbi:MAG: hypothetical protein HC782_00055 [Gammaproteobacteria bacterium]|nr:hypothetical protein [Gammaproteobacteria bacterium]